MKYLIPICLFVIPVLGQSPGYLYETRPIIGNMLYVPSGTFIQGSKSYDSFSIDDEAEYVHTLTRDLLVMETEITRKMWEDLMLEYYSLPLDPSIDMYSPDLEHPVQYCSWYETILFANYLSMKCNLTPCYYSDESMQNIYDASNLAEKDTVYCNFDSNGFRLPTEGEAEFYIRAGTIRNFFVNQYSLTWRNCRSCEYSSELTILEKVAVFCKSKSSPAGTKESNPWGFKDVVGNVAEWCWDWYSETYPTDDQIDYRGPVTGERKVVRGGSFLSEWPCDLRSAARRSLFPHWKDNSTGFRLVRTIDLNTHYPYIIPHIPSSNSGWKSEIKLFNTSDTAVKLTLDTFESQDDGFTLISTQNLNVAGRQALSLSSITNQLGHQRWIGIHTDELLGGDFSFSFNRGQGQEKVTLPIMRLNNDQLTLIFPHIPSNRSLFWSGFSIVNPQGEPASLTFKLVGTKGTDLSYLLTDNFQGKVTLAAYEKKVSLFEGTVFNDTENSEKVSWVSVSSDKPIAGFELFGKHASSSKGELAGIEARHFHGAEILQGFPFSVKEVDWNGFSLLNTSARKNHKVTLNLYKESGELIVTKIFSMKAGVKFLGLLTPTGFTFPYGSDSPLIQLSQEEALDVSSASIYSLNNCALFTLSGTGNEEFDGLSSSSFHNSLGIALPSSPGQTTLNVCSDSTLPELVSIRVYDQNQKVTYVDQISLQSNGFASLLLPNFQTPALVEINGQNRESRLSTFLHEHNVNYGLSYSVHQATPISSDASREEITGEVIMPADIDPAGIMVVTTSGATLLGKETSAFGFQLAIDRDGVELIAITGPNNEIYALAIPGPEISAGLKSKTGFTLNATSTALALISLHPSSGVHLSRDISAHIFSVISNTPEFLTLTNHLQSKLDESLPPVSGEDTELINLLVQAQSASIHAIEQIISSSPKKKLESYSVYNLIPGVGSDDDGLDASFTNRQNTPLLTIHNWNKRYIALYQKGNNTNPFNLQKTDFLGYIQPSYDPATWEQFLGTESQIKSTNMFSELLLLPTNPNFTEIFAIGSGSSGESPSFTLYDPSHRELMWPYFWKDFVHRQLAPFLTLVTTGKNSGRLISLLEDSFKDFHDLLYHEFMNSDELNSPDIVYQKAVQHMYTFALSQLMKNDGNEMKRFMRVLEGKEGNSADGTFAVVAEKLGVILQSCNLNHSDYISSGKSISDQETSQISQYKLIQDMKPPQILFFDSTSSTLLSGDTAMLSWQCNHCDSVTISGISGLLENSGTTPIIPSETTTYTLTAMGTLESTRSELTVTVTDTFKPEIHSFTATPAHISSGDYTVLSWDCSNADVFVISDVGEFHPPTASAVTSPFRTRTYTLTASGKGGTAEKQVTVEVDVNIKSGTRFSIDPIVGAMRIVLSDSFLQGSTTDSCRDSDERPFIHSLPRDILVMETEVTRGMWRTLQLEGINFPPDPSSDFISYDRDFPVDTCTWQQAVLFANVLSVKFSMEPCYFIDASMTTRVDVYNYESQTIYCDFNANGYRLPTEGEWEYFARAGTISPFSVYEPYYKDSTCGSCTTPALTALNNRATYCVNSDYTQNVLSKAPNAWGISGIHGNVWDWCWDWYKEDYPQDTYDDYKGPQTGSDRTRRGGSFQYSAKECRSANRDYFPPDERDLGNGFRLVRTYTGD